MKIKILTLILISLPLPPTLCTAISSLGFMERISALNEAGFRDWVDLPATTQLLAPSMRMESRLPALWSDAVQNSEILRKSEPGRPPESSESQHSLQQHKHFAFPYKAPPSFRQGRRGHLAMNAAARSSHAASTHALQYLCHPPERPVAVCAAGETAKEENCLSPLQGGSGPTRT